MARDAVVEGEAAGEAAGGPGTQALAGPAQAPLDVAEVVFQGIDGRFELPPQLLEAPLPFPQQILDALAPGRRGAGRGIAHPQ